MQTILGAGGAIGVNLAKELKSYTDKVRLVGRSPKQMNGDDEIYSADITNKEAVYKAIEGSGIVYLVAGLPYKTKAWQQQWPLVMQNVIAACKDHKAKLVFFDNVYAYEKNALVNMTEEALFNPPSKKGLVRAEIANTLLQAIHKNEVEGMIVRSADFYGPGINNSMLLETVYKNLKKGKAAYWLGNANKVHSFTYTPDAAKATALLGNTHNAYNQTWHLPTSDEKLTGNDWVDLFAEKMHVKNKKTTFSTTAVKLLGVFNPFMRELTEMMYQNTQDYYFDCTKFKNRFPTFHITSYDEGVQNVIDWDKK